MNIPDLASEKTDTASKILLTAEKLFAKKGFECVSVRELANECGVNVSLISYHFGGKQQLLEKIIESRTSMILQGIKQCQTSDYQDLPGLLKTTIMQTLNMLSGAECFMQVLINELSGDSRHGLKLKVTDIILEARKMMVSIIKDGQSQGIFRKEVDAEVMIMIIDNGLFKFQQSPEISIRSMGGDPNCTHLWADCNKNRIQNFVIDIVDNYLTEPMYLK